jgi:putative acetyltransferase
MHIRPEQIDDRASIYDLLCQAFPTPEEALLVERLRESGSATVALVAIAEDDNGEHDVVGHVVFSPVELEPQTPWPGLGLAPLAVRPRVHRQGIGSQLVQAGLEACRAAGAGFVVVLGDPAYYSRFGFVRASQYGLLNEYGVDEEFMALELQPGCLSYGGLVRYGAAFAAFGPG